MHKQPKSKDSAEGEEVNKGWLGYDFVFFGPSQLGSWA